MASPEWLEIFRSYSDAELTAHIDKLKQEISVYSSQGSGSKNYTKDLGELRSQLSSAIRVQTDRATPGETGPRVGVFDFQNVSGG